MGNEQKDKKETNERKEMMKAKERKAVDANITEN